MIARPAALLVATVAAVAASVVVGPAATARARNCAFAPDDVSPRAIVSGTAVDRHGIPVLEAYDFAITGTVVAITTDEVGGSPTYGDTRVVFQVIDGYELQSVPGRMVVRQLDPGWLNGYPFQVGETYFVPLAARGPNGEANFSDLCDFISPITVAEAHRLPDAAAPGLAVSSPLSEAVPETTMTTDAVPPSGAPVSTTASTDGGDASDDGVVVVLVVSAVALVVALAATLVIARRRRAN